MYWEAKKTQKKRKNKCNQLKHLTSNDASLLKIQFNFILIHLMAFHAYNEEIDLQR